MRKLLIGLVAVVLVFLGYVSTRDGTFLYARSGVINASAEEIYPYLSSFKMASQWSPYEKKDPTLKRTFLGADGEVGSVMEFDGNSDVGAGRLEFLKIVPTQLVELKLTMTKPIHAENLIQYKLTPEGAGTRFTWSMSGDGGYLTKLVSVFIDCEKMIAGDLDQGIANLKTLVETAGK